MTVKASWDQGKRSTSRLPRKMSFKIWIWIKSLIVPELLKIFEYRNMPLVRILQKHYSFENTCKNP